MTENRNQDEGVLAGELRAGNETELGRIAEIIRPESMPDDVVLRFDTGSPATTVSTDVDVPVEGQ